MLEKQKSTKRKKTISIFLTMILTISMVATVFAATVRSKTTYFPLKNYAKLYNYIIKDTEISGGEFIKVYSGVEGNCGRQAYFDLGTGSKWSVMNRVVFVNNSGQTIVTVSTGGRKFSGTVSVFVWGGYYGGYGFGNKRTINNNYKCKLMEGREYVNTTYSEYTEYNPNGSIAYYSDLLTSLIY